MDVEGIILPITFRPIVLFSVGVWGWALNLFILSKCGIDTTTLLQLHHTDKHNPLYKPIFVLSAIISFIVFVHLVLYWFFQYTANVSLFAYITSTFLLLWPGKLFQRRERFRFLRMLGRVFTLNLLAPVFFSDVILADMLTSFSNVFGDLFVAICVLITGQDAAYFIDNADNIYYRDFIIPLLISMPYLIRLKQCIAEYVVSKERRHIFNSLKYASSIPVVVSSAFHRKALIYVSETGTVPKHWYMSHDTIFHFWILFVFINSMYSFWWDISMDWNLINVSKSQPPVMEEIPQSSTPSIHFRRQLYFSQPIWYVLAIFVDFLLRITWSLKLSSHIYIRKLNGSMFLMEVFEISRRWMWVIFRLESEWVKKVYTTLPSSNNSSGNPIRMNMMRRKSAGLLSPIDEEEDSSSS